MGASVIVSNLVFKQSAISRTENMVEVIYDVLIVVMNVSDFLQ